MTSRELRQKFLDFFSAQNHAVLNSVSLVTDDKKGITNSTLFNTAGMQPLVSFLMGKNHPKGTRLVSSQKCLRTIDIEEVGDRTHLTFFEMLGNWSLGDYFKEESIQWSYEFLTKELGLNPKNIYVTVFAGNNDIPRDDESYKIWQKFISPDRIFFLEENWWEAGENGPAGIDTEIFYDITEKKNLNLKNKKGFLKANTNQEVVEIWNNVFLEYKKEDGKIVGKLEHQNVDTGAGLERLLAIVNKKNSVFETDLFNSIITLIKASAQEYNESSARIISDHIKSSILLIWDGVLPSNTDRGYILRRLIRRAVRHSDKIKLSNSFITQVIPLVNDLYKNLYAKPEVDVYSILAEEENKFRNTLKTGIKEFDKISQKITASRKKIINIINPFYGGRNKISGEESFKLFSTYGFPIELTQELAKEKGIKVDLIGFKLELEKHQKKSRTSAVGKFKGGLRSANPKEIQYHTATHLLLAALREVLGDHVEQKGSNITEERLRFDFSHSQKLTEEEKEEIEKFVNEKIAQQLTVKKDEMNYDEAKQSGAIGVFEDKYGKNVTVYTISSDDNIVSKEICGGPHVLNTKELGRFSIKKEEASSSGVRRIKATLG